MTTDHDRARHRHDLETLSLGVDMLRSMIDTYLACLDADQSLTDDEDVDVEDGDGFSDAV